MCRMPQAPHYDRSTDFAGDEANNRGGRSTVATADVNAELDAVSQSVNALSDNAALIQRDDGALRDGVVSVASLSPEVSKYLQAVGGVPRGAWVTATAYNLRDVVTQSGNT